MADRPRSIDAPPVPRNESPAAMAARLAGEAKARLAPAPAPSGLAASAPPPGRSSLAAAAPPPARPRPAAPPPSYDDGGDEFSTPAPAAQAKKKKAKEEATPAPAFTAPPPLAARIAPKKLTAADAIRLAMEEEERAEIVAASARPVALAAPRAAAPTVQPAVAAPQLVAQPAAPRPFQSPDAVLRAVLPSATVSNVTPVANAIVLRALFQAHRARGVMTHDLQLVAASCVLADAAERVPQGRLFALRANLAGTEYAAFIDCDRGVLLALVAPPDLYLAGL